jgi:hypothetical protein
MTHKFNLRKRPQTQSPIVQKKQKANSGKKVRNTKTTSERTEGVNGKLDNSWVLPQTKAKTPQKKAAKKDKETQNTEPVKNPNSQQGEQTLNDKLDQILNTVNNNEAQLSAIEKSAAERNPAQQDTNPKTYNIEDLIREIENKRAENNNTVKEKDSEELTVTKEDLDAIDTSTRQPQEFNFADQSTDTNIESIRDLLAKVIEKRRLTFIRNWSIIWPRLQSIPNKPAIPDKTWKRLAFGQYIDLAEFLTQDA